MSEPGLYAHLYSYIRDCAELIDHVIVDLETGGNTTVRSERETLAALLRTLQTAPFTTLSTTLLSAVLKERRLSVAPDWSKVADGIVRGDASKAVVEPLGELARALESERAGVHARIQSSYAR
jgi:hypothetical protein